MPDGISRSFARSRWYRLSIFSGRSSSRRTGESIDLSGRVAARAAINVQNVSVGDGGKANVGNITRHAGVIASVAGRSLTCKDASVGMQTIRQLY
jgi:hypothetical protein